MKKNLLLILSIMMLHELPAQWKGSIEQYHYFMKKPGENVVPILQIQTAKNWYCELRYNYEETGAFSINTGKVFIVPGKWQSSITPVLGFVTGSLNGYNFGMNQKTEWKNFYFSSQTQYTFSLKSRDENFFYSWLEAGYNLSEKFFAGVSVQFTRMFQQKLVNNKGLVLGLSVNKWSFPVYFFEPYNSNRFFIVGINYKWQLKQAKRKMAKTKTEKEPAIEQVVINTHQ